MSRAEMMLSFVRKATRPLATRIRLMISRGIVKLVDDSFKMQALQVELHGDELHDEVERFEDYGMTAHPFTDSEALYLSIGGDRSAGVVVRVSDRRHRPKDLGEGDVCLYTDKGERVFLERAGDIVHIGAKSAAEFIAMGAKTDSRIKAVEDWLISTLTIYAQTHQHSYVAPLIPLPGSPIPTVTPLVPPTVTPPLTNGSSVQASKAKVT